MPREVTWRLSEDQRRTVNPIDPYNQFLVVLGFLDAADISKSSFSSAFAQYSSNSFGRIFVLSSVARAMGHRGLTPRLR